MNRANVDGVLADLVALAMSRADPELRAVEAALVLEDVFDVCLSDAQMEVVVRGDDPRVLARILGITPSRL